MYNSPVITNKGYSAITHALAVNQKLDIQRMLLSSDDYSSAILENFDIADFNIKLSAGVIVSKEKVEIEEGGEKKERIALKNYSIFTNEDVLVAFDVKSVAVTCLDENGVEIILAIIIATAPYDPIHDKTISDTFSFIMSLIFDGSDNIQVTTTGDGLITEKELNEKTIIEDSVPTKSDLPTSAEYHNKTVKVEDEGEMYKFVNTGISINEKTYATVTEATKTESGYEYCSDSGKYYLNGEEIQVITPIPDNPEVGKYYTDVVYLLKNGVINNEYEYMKHTNYANGSYIEGVGLVQTGACWWCWNFNLTNLKAKGYTKVKIKLTDNTQLQVGDASTYPPTGSQFLHNEGVKQTPVDKLITYDISSLTSFFSTYQNATLTITDIWFEKAEVTLYKAEDIWQWSKYITEADLPEMPNIIDNATSTEISKYKGLILATGSAPTTIPVGYEYATFES